jgi:hypothetical protein
LACVGEKGPFWFSKERRGSMLKAFFSKIIYCVKFSHWFMPSNVLNLFRNMIILIDNSSYFI